MSCIGIIPTDIVVSAFPDHTQFSDEGHHASVQIGNTVYNICTENCHFEQDEFGIMHLISDVEDGSLVHLSITSSVEGSGVEGCGVVGMALQFDFEGNFSELMDKASVHLANGGQDELDISFFPQDNCDVIVPMIEVDVVPVLPVLPVDDAEKIDVAVIAPDQIIEGEDVIPVPLPVVVPTEGDSEEPEVTIISPIMVDSHHA